MEEILGEVVREWLLAGSGRDGVPTYAEGYWAKARWLTAPRGGEVAGQLLGHFAGDRPFAAASKRSDKTDAFLRIVAVAHRRVEDASLAESERHQHSARDDRCPLWRGRRRRWPAPPCCRRGRELVVQLILHMQPSGGHAGGDGVFGVTDDNLERVLRAVMAARAFALVANQFAGFAQIDIRPAGFCFGRPSRPSRSWRCIPSTWGRSYSRHGRWSPPRRSGQT